MVLIIFSNLNVLQVTVIFAGIPIIFGSPGIYFFFVCYTFQSSSDNPNKSCSRFCRAYLSSSSSVSILLHAVFCGDFGSLGILGVSLARGFENIASRAESAGLSVLRDSVCIPPGVGGLDYESEELREELADDKDEDDDEED